MSKIVFVILISVVALISTVILSPFVAILSFKGILFWRDLHSEEIKNIDDYKQPGDEKRAAIITGVICVVIFISIILVSSISPA